MFVLLQVASSQSMRDMNLKQEVWQRPSKKFRKVLLSFGIWHSVVLPILNQKKT
jgi:hypothetical protein